MSKFIMLVGPAGVGKSTYASECAKEENALIISTDAIRKEIYGDENVLGEFDEILEVAYSRIIKAAKENVSVVFDATNMKSGRRAAVLSLLRDYDITKECVVIVDTPAQCEKNMKKRSRVVPIEDVIKQLCAFQFPQKNEGWDKVTVLNKIQNKELEYKTLNQIISKTESSKQLSSFEDFQEALTNSNFVKRFYNFYKMAAAYKNNISDNVWKYSKLASWFYLCFSDINNIEAVEKDTKLIEENDIQNVKLLKFINKHENWKELIKSDPYNITVKEEGEYILLKYNQFDSDMFCNIAKESRGCIIKKNDDKMWQYVCRPFDKFFNYGETEKLPKIDYPSMKITEKIDGSLIKIFYDAEGWHLATNNTINAFNAIISEYGISFGDVFQRALKCDLRAFMANLNKDYTYMFELTADENKLVISYDEGVYYLAARNTKTGKELMGVPEEILKYKEYLNFPEEYKFNSFEEAIECVKSLKSKEGFVICDKNGNRIKLKSDEYLERFHSEFCNEHISDKQIIKYIQDETIDDISAAYPKINDRVEIIKNKINNLALEYEKAWGGVKEQAKTMNKKDFAMSLSPNNLGANNYIFSRYDEKCENAKEYLLSLLTPSLYRLLEKADSELVKE